MKKRKKIRNKMIAYCTVFVIIISIVSAGFGYYMYYFNELENYYIYFELKDYIIINISGTAIISMLFSIFIIRKINKLILRPLNKLTYCADTLISQSDDKSKYNNIFKESDIKSNNEIGLLNDCLNSMVEYLTKRMENLESVTVEKDRFGAELNIAKQIQSDMLPSVFPAFPERTEFDIYANMYSAKEVGGDFYDFFLIDEIHLGIVIADISGIGIPAALLMVITKTLIKNYAQLGLEPSKVLVETNNKLCEDKGTEMAVNLFLGVVNLYNGYFTYVNAGDHSPLLRRAGGQFERLSVKNGFVLGGMEKVPYYQEEIKLLQGDMLFLYTNGVKRVENDEGYKYSESNLIECLNISIQNNYDMKLLIDDIKKDMDGFCLGKEQREDITMMLFRYFGI